jgi:hypothetical protein
VTGHDPGGRVNFFDVLTVAIAFGVASVTCLAMRDPFGTITAVLVGLLAALLAAFFVQFLVHLKFRSFVRELDALSTRDLRERLQTEYFVSHLIIPILLRRDEPVSELREYTLGLLASGAAVERWHGWRSLSLWFPETAAALAGLDPLKPTAEYFERVEALRQSGG